MIGSPGTRRRLRGVVITVAHAFHRLGRVLSRSWRRSLQLRVVVSTLALSLMVILILGFVLSSQITNRMLEAKVDAASEEIDRARGTVDRMLENSDPSSSLESRLEEAKSALTDPTTDGQAGNNAGAFEPVLIVPGAGPRKETSAGPVNEVPDSLRGFVRAGKVSYQYTTVPDGSGIGSALVVGTPAGSDISPIELYMIFPLTAEERSLSLVQGILLTGGLVLLGLLAAISLLVARQVVLPVRYASRIAERFADGRLKERMPVHGEDDIARLAVSFNDMAENLSRQITQLEEYGNLQKRFTSDVSHELRTPLTTVRMAADLIHDNSDELDPVLRRSAELLTAELDRFEALLGDLLEISRHDAGVAELAAEKLDLRACARAALETVEYLAAESGSTLVVDLPDEAVVAEVDPRRVERILRNLLANALDHGEGKPVALRMRADEDTVAVVVADAGLGLRPGEEKLVFNRFWRADPSRVRRSGGTGLGLAISMEDARLHNGRLEASGSPGKGASFRLTLPRKRGAGVVSYPLPLRVQAPASVPALEAAAPDRASPGPDLPGAGDVEPPAEGDSGDGAADGASIDTSGSEARK
ncbi:MtrAB system histidine kinase MtrB [Tomitella fengzijianii]